jgi:hypothetical protein
MIHYYGLLGGRIAQSVLRTSTGSTVLGSNRDGADNFNAVQTGPDAHPTTSAKDTGPLPRAWP